MKLSGEKIREEYEGARLVIDPFDVRCLGPNSYDLHLSEHLFVYDEPSGFDVKEEPRGHHFQIGPEGFLLMANRLYLGSTVEVCGSDHHLTCIDGRSSVGRLGLVVHQTAGFGDVGFVNHWTLEMVAVDPIRIYPGMRICQAYFEPVLYADSEKQQAARRYAGKYKDRDPRPMPSKIYRDFLAQEFDT